VLSPHVFQFADCVASILVDGFGIFLQNARCGVADHLSDKEIGHSRGAHATSARVPKIVDNKKIQSGIA